MKKTLIALSLFALPVSASLAASYTIDPSHTYPNFEINHLGFSTMHGRFGTTSGSMEFDPAAKRRSRSKSTPPRSTPATRSATTTCAHRTS